MSQHKKLVTYTPTSHAEAVRQAIGNAGGGKIGNYANCSFSTPGTGRFLPLEGANPAIGTVGVAEAVEEERIEVTCQAEDIEEVVAAIKKIHPYEEVPIELYDITLA